LSTKTTLSADYSKCLLCLICQSATNNSKVIYLLLQMTTLNKKEIAIQILEHVHLGAKNLARREAFLIAAMRKAMATGFMCERRITILH
jgi:hypothetical protein